VCVLALLATACGGSGGGAAKTAPAPGGDRTVTIANFEFSPDTLQAKVGDTITVQNKDSAEHTVTATDGSFDTGRFASGTKTFTVTKAGRIEFACNVHPFMTHKFIQVAG
jgi:plastocyanin